MSDNSHCHFSHVRLCSACNIDAHPTPHTPPTLQLTAGATCLKESLFYLIMPLEHIDFHIIGYWTTNIWSLRHISLEETGCRHIGYSFP